MAEIKDPAYLFVENPDDPDYGKTIAVEFEDFKKNAKEWKAQGYRPATGNELAPVQRGMEKEIAAEHPETAAALGGLRGATFGLSDVALERSGLADEGSLETLREANPNISMASELTGGLVSAGGVAKGVGSLAKGIPSVMGRRVATGAGLGALSGAGAELSEQARVGEGYNAGDVVASSMVGGTVGGAIPVVGSMVKPAAGALYRTGLRGVEKAGSLVDKAYGKLDEVVDAASGKLGERLPPALRGTAPGAIVGGGSELLSQFREGELDLSDLATATVMSGVTGKVAGGFARSYAKPVSEMARRLVEKSATRAADSKELRRLTNQMLELNPRLSTRDAQRMVKDLLTRAVESNPLGGTGAAMSSGIGSIGRRGSQGLPSNILEDFKHSGRVLNRWESKMGAKKKLEREAMEAAEALRRQSSKSAAITPVENFSASESKIEAMVENLMSENPKLPYRQARKLANEILSEQQLNPIDSDFIPFL